MVNFVAAESLVVALSCYSLALLALLMPLLIPWTRRLGYCGAWLAVSLFLSLAGAGTHHLVFGLNMLLDPSYYREESYQLFLWSTLEPLGLFINLTIIAFKGPTIVRVIRGEQDSC